MHTGRQLNLHKIKLVDAFVLYGNFVAYVVSCSRGVHRSGWSKFFKLKNTQVNLPKSSIVSII